MQGFRPDDQRLLILLQKYILVKSHAGKEVSGPGQGGHGPVREMWSTTMDGCASRVFRLNLGHISRYQNSCHRYLLGGSARAEECRVAFIL